MTAEPETLVRRWYDDLFAAEKLDTLTEIAASNCVVHAPGGEALEGLDAIGAMLERYHSAFSIERWTIHDVIVSDDRAVVRASGDTRYVGGWHGIPGSNQPVHETTINIFRIADGLIVEVWFEASDLDVARQLGAFPPTPPR